MPVEGQPFNPDSLLDMARALAKRPYSAPSADLPDGLTNLTYDQYMSIRARPNARLFAGEGRGSVIELLHRGFLFTRPVQVYVIEDGTVRRVAYDPSRFDFGKVTPPQNPGDLGFSGLRIFGDGQGDAMREVAVIQGATFFRSCARGQNFGVMSRALGLKIAEQRGEEIPFFRAFWIEKPANLDAGLVIHALIDSESVVGVWRATIRAGEVTVVDVETTLVARAVLDHVGLGTMSATYLFGPNDRRGNDDVRTGVYEVSGLQMLNGRGEWIWRPLHNPETLQISAFIDENPRGFGLLQRDRDFASFQDDDQAFERRPSLWIEPIGDWGPGTVQLVEIPTDSEVNDNIIAYWRPKTPIPAGGETSFAYRQFWCWSPPERPPLASVTAVRVGRGSSAKRKRFLVDFTGDVFAQAGRMVEMKPILSATPGAVADVRILPYPERNSCRIAFELEHGNETLSEIRLTLEGGGKPLSETLLYRWTP